TFCNTVNGMIGCGAISPELCGTAQRRAKSPSTMRRPTMSGTPALDAWVEECARLTRPERIVWCDGSEREYADLVAVMLQDGTLVRINDSVYPNSYLHRSDPTDVARTEHLTYICTEREEDAGPTNNWMAPKEGKALLRPLFN